MEEKIYVDKGIEKEIRKRFQEEETKQDKKYLLQELNKLISELYKEIKE